jgi:UDP-3-O-[3-hydroxymyristoyl] glucosamine N-acyltransferase
MIDFLFFPATIIIIGVFVIFISQIYSWFKNVAFKIGKRIIEIRKLVLNAFIIFIKKMIYQYKNFIPVIHESSFIHPQSAISGNVIIGKNVYIGPGAG